MTKSRIVVTGGAVGIGRWMTDALREDGHQVVVLDIAPSRDDDIVCDVASADAVTEAVAQATERMGGVDVAVHNACQCPFVPFLEAGDDTFRRVWEVNYLGAVHLARAVLPDMLTRGSGRVAFTSSGVAVTGFTDISPYAASKGAIEALARCLRAEFHGRGVSFHLLHPPLTRTASAAGLPVPEEMKADPEKVGAGLARHLFDNRFVITHSRVQAAQMRASYLFPLRIANLLVRATRGAATP